MTEKITKKLYGGNVVIDFYPTSHRYKLAGQRSFLISVTAATGIIDKSRMLIPWAVNLGIDHIRQYLEERAGEKFTAEELYSILDEARTKHTQKKEEAASIGGLVHAWAEAFAESKINGTEPPEISDDMPEPVLNGISGFLDWYNSHNVEFIENERMLYSKIYEYVGITDAIAKVNGKKVIIDYKTSKNIYSEMHYQLSAYFNAYEEETADTLDGAMILHFCKETGNFEAKEINREDLVMNFNTFINCLNIKRREKELN